MASGRRVLRTIGAIRALVGVAMIVAPRLASGGREEPGFLLLMRTIGIRDLVLGLGAATARDPSLRAWSGAALASDGLDVVAGALSTPSIGRSAGLVATLLPLPFAAAGIVGLVTSAAEAGDGRSRSVR